MGKGKNQLWRLSFRWAEEDHRVLISREPRQSMACFGPERRTPSPSLLSSTQTSRAEEAWPRISVLTTTLQAPRTGLQMIAGRNVGPLNRLLASGFNCFLWLGRDQRWSSPQVATEHPKLLGGDHGRRPTLNLSPRSLWTISSSSLAVLLQNWEKSLIQRSLSLACNEQMYFRVTLPHAHACTCKQRLTDTHILTATLAMLGGSLCFKAPAIREIPSHLSF